MPFFSACEASTIAPQDSSLLFCKLLWAGVVQLLYVLPQFLGECQVLGAIDWFQHAGRVNRGSVDVPFWYSRFFSDFPGPSSF